MGEEKIKVYYKRGILDVCYDGKYEKKKFISANSTNKNVEIVKVDVVIMIRTSIFLLMFEFLIIIVI